MAKIDRNNSYNPRHDFAPVGLLERAWGTGGRWGAVSQMWEGTDDATRHHWHGGSARGLWRPRAVSRCQHRPRRIMHVNSGLFTDAARRSAVRAHRTDA